MHDILTENCKTCPERHGDCIGCILRGMDATMQRVDIAVAVGYSRGSVSSMRDLYATYGLPYAPRSGWEHRSRGAAPDIILEVDGEPKAVSDSEAIAILRAKGFRIHTEPDTTDHHFHIDTKRFTGDSIKFAIVSDTHLGSKYQQLTHLKSAYRYCAEEGIEHVLNPGDVCAGNGRVYRGQMFEVFRHGSDQMRDYIIEHYPQEEGVTTHLIAGNHDLSFMSSEGYDICRAVAEAREDISHLGHYGAYLHLGPLVLYLHHGEGGASYARSYKPQQVIGNIGFGEAKPHCVIMGHWHVSNLLPMYRNVVGISCPSFESQTPYLKRKGYWPEIGFWVVSATINDADRIEGTTRWQFEFVPFYVPKEHDY